MPELVQQRADIGDGSEKTFVEAFDLKHNPMQFDAIAPPANTTSPDITLGVSIQMELWIAGN